MAATLFESVSPILAVQDLPHALQFYRDTLGFEIAWTWGEPASMAAVCRDNVEITLAQRPDAQPPGRSHIYLRVFGIDDYYARIEGAGAKIAVTIGDRDYGMRDFRVVDPSGNEIDVGQPTAES